MDSQLCDACSEVFRNDQFLRRLAVRRSVPRRPEKAGRFLSCAMASYDSYQFELPAPALP